MVCLGRPYHFNFFKGYFLQILLGPFLNTLTYISFIRLSRLVTFFAENDNNNIDNKQMFHAFLFNIGNYSPEVINIQRREAELNIIFPRLNNFDIRQKRHGIFVLLMPPTPHKIWEDKD